VVNEVLDLISKQLATAPNIDALLLVGGFSGSTYLKTCVEVSYKSLVLFFRSSHSTVHVLWWFNFEIELC
jgi:hypothetical protein